MRHRLDLYEITNTTSEAVLGPILSGTWKRGLPNDDSLEFTLPMYDALGERLYDTNDDATAGNQRYTLTPQKWVRLVDIDLATSRSYVIREITKTRNADGQAVFNLKCEGYAFKYLDKIVPIVSDFAGVTATIFLDQILAGSGLTAGTNQIPTTEKRTVSIAYPNVVEALNVITDNWDETAGGVKKRFFWRINENNTVDILREDTYGSTLAPKFTPKRSVLSLAKEVSSRKLVNRMFASTQDGMDLIESQRTGYYDKRGSVADFLITTVGNTTTLTLNGAGDTSNKLGVKSIVFVSVFCVADWKVTSTTAHNITYRVSVELQTSGGTQRVVREKELTVFSGGGDNLTGQDILFFLEVGSNTDAEKLAFKYVSVVGDTGQTDSTQIQIRYIRYWTAPNVNYVDGANQGTYGIVESVFKDEHFPIQSFNLISDWKQITGTLASPTITLKKHPADFSGTYTAGLCEGWTKDSGVTATENTDKAFIVNGTKSQKLGPSTPALGVDVLKIDDTFGPLAEGRSYFVQLIVFIVQGSIKFNLNNLSAGVTPPAADSINYSIAGKSLIVLTIENFTPVVGGNYQIVIQNSTPSGLTLECYIDSVVVTAGTGPRPFTLLSIADDIRIAASSRMGLNEAPAKTFSLDVADLGELEPNVNAAERFQPGDYIKIDDKTLNVLATLRVQQKTTDLINPEKSQIAVELLPTRPGDILFKALGRPELALQRS